VGRRLLRPHPPSFFFFPCPPSFFPLLGLVDRKPELKPGQQFFFFDKGQGEGRYRRSSRVAFSLPSSPFFPPFFFSFSSLNRREDVEGLLHLFLKKPRFPTVACDLFFFSFFFSPPFFFI